MDISDLSDEELIALSKTRKVIGLETALPPASKRIRRVVTIDPTTGQPVYRPRGNPNWHKGMPGNEANRAKAREMAAIPKIVPEATLDGLPPHVQAAIRMHIRGRSIEEIRKAVNKSEQTLRFWFKTL